MKTYITPPRADWQVIAARPTIAKEALNNFIQKAYKDIDQAGDAALLDYARKYDGLRDEGVTVSTSMLRNLADRTPKELRRAIDIAYRNIRSFHAAQMQPNTERQEVMPGVKCWQEPRPIDRIGLYVPGGLAPLVSTVLMLGVPAKLAGCSDIVLCTPARSPESIDPAIAYAAQVCGIDTLFCLGGAQAIAAMAVGTQTIPKVDKIFGPGNQYVTAAKEYAWNYGTAIDMPAGPSEVLVVADASARADFVAADLLSQLEHGPDSQAILVADSQAVLDNVKNEVMCQLVTLPRRDIAAKAWRESIGLVLPDIAECIAFSNVYAPEHMIVNVERAGEYLANITNAGSVFVGQYSPESAGDYASGTNHTLPTAGWARSYSGLSVGDFQKQLQFQRLTKQGITALNPTIQQLASAEGLDAHARASAIRLT
jgi:histidinol dehydrogenase